jgi:hypothetical protein
LAGFGQFFAEKFQFPPMEVEEGAELGFPGFPIQAFLRLKRLDIDDLGNGFAQLDDGRIGVLRLNEGAGNEYG